MTDHNIHAPEALGPGERSPRLDLGRSFEMVEEALLAGALAATFVVLLLQVFSRYVFNWPLAWTEELARYLFIWSVFIGASQALRHGEHIAIGMVLERLPVRIRAIVEICMNLLVATFLLVVIVKGHQLAMKVIDLPSTALEWSMAFVYAPLPLAAIVMLIRILRDSWLTVTIGPAHIEHRSL